MTVLAVASMLTFFHRVVHVYRVSRRDRLAAADAQSHTGATPRPGDTTT
jgi:hypothetical protein